MQARACKGSVKGARQEPYRFGRGHCSRSAWVYGTGFMWFNSFIPNAPFLKT